MKESWDVIISKKRVVGISVLTEIYNYRDLLSLLVLRDYRASFKQTILGPIWYFIQPVLTTIIFMFLFNRVIKIDTDGIPSLAFYYSGVILWTSFSINVNTVSNVLVSNSKMMSKVYFPRIILVLSSVISNFIRLGVQFLLLIFILIYFNYSGEINTEFGLRLFIIPLAVVLNLFLAMSIGLIVASLSTKYRDFIHLVTFGLQLMMYVTPIIYPFSSVTGRFSSILTLNPLTGIIETFRKILFTQPDIQWQLFIYSAIFTILLTILSFVFFNRAQRDFIDSI